MPKPEDFEYEKVERVCIENLDRSTYADSSSKNVNTQNVIRKSMPSVDARWSKDVNKWWPTMQFGSQVTANYRCDDGKTCLTARPAIDRKPSRLSMHGTISAVFQYVRNKSRLLPLVDDLPIGQDDI